MIVRSTNVLMPDGLRAAAIHIRDGRIAAIEPSGRRTASADVIDAGELIVMAGLVDSHVHVNEPGRTDWEGFFTATRAAAAGGVTTLVDMPLNSIPPTTTAKNLEAKRRAAMEQCHVDVAFWGGVVPGNVTALDELAAAGVRGFKCFLSPSGVDEFAHVTERDLREAMPIVSRLGLPLLAHAELPSALRGPIGDPRRYETWLNSRPAAAEVAAIDLLIELAHEFGTHVHIVHLATADALPSIRQARNRGVALTIETCPHYLTFTAEAVQDGQTSLKCAPPIRAEAERERLWEALIAGDIDLIASDHSPAPKGLKHIEDGDFVAAWGGIASLQLGLSAVWAGAAERHVPIDRLGQWLVERPARLAGLFPTKGTIAVGADADLVIWDPHVEQTIEARTLYHRHQVTPYDGRRLRGRVHTTILRGVVVFDDGECRGPAVGRVL